MGAGQQDGRAVFEILVREHADMLLAYLRALLGRDSAVDDIFQQTMLVAWRRLGEFDPTRPFAPWLRGIARKLMLEHLRQRRARAFCSDPAVMAELEGQFDALAAKPGDTFRERAERLADCLKRLPDSMRQVIEMCYSRGLALQSIASAIDLSEEAVKKRVQRGRQLLAECLGNSNVGEAR